jgi:hypothetical protein
MKMSVEGGTFIEFYSKYRLELLAGMGKALLAIALQGNPGGTRNLDQWYQDLMEYL